MAKQCDEQDEDGRSHQIAAHGVVSRSHRRGIRWDIRCPIVNDESAEPGPYNMNLLKSAFLARGATRSCTYLASMVTVAPARSVAVKLMSSSRRSITVCRRRAPMFSTEELISAARSARASME